MLIRKIFTRVVAALMLFGMTVTAIAVWKATRVKAFNPQPDPPAYGLFGITHEQTARLGARVFVPDSAQTERLRPVVLELEFHDIEDNSIRSVSLTVQPGHGAFLDLNGAEVPGSDAVRVEYQPCVTVLDNPNGENKVQVIPSIEVFDNFGPEAGKTRMAGGIWSGRDKAIQGTR